MNKDRMFKPKEVRALPRCELVWSMLMSSVNTGRQATASVAGVTEEGLLGRQVVTEGLPTGGGDD